MFLGHTANGVLLQTILTIDKDLGIMTSAVSFENVIAINYFEATNISSCTLVSW